MGFRFAPRVEASGELIFFSVDGLQGLFPGGEKAICQALIQASSQVGLNVRVAIADNKSVAYAFTLCHRLSVVPKGQGGKQIASLPLTRVTGAADPSETSLLSALKRWGLRTLGDLAA